MQGSDHNGSQQEMGRQWQELAGPATSPLNAQTVQHHCSPKNWLSTRGVSQLKAGRPCP